MGFLIYYDFHLQVQLMKVVNDSHIQRQNARRPSKHPPVRGGKMSKVLGGIKGCKYKTPSWYINGFPDGNNIGSTVLCRGEAHRYTVHLH